MSVTHNCQAIGSITSGTTSITKHLFSLIFMLKAKKEPIKKEYINPKKLPVANASYEPDGETISEEEEEKQNPTFVQFMQRIEQLPEVTREAIKNCGNDPAIAKAALEISGIDK